MKKIKILNVFLIVFFIITAISSNVSFAKEATSNFDLDYYESDVDGYGVRDVANDALGSAINVVRIVGIGISIIIMTIIAIKYMFASAGDRAEIKKHAIPYVVGAVILFGASALFGIIINFADVIKV